MRQSRLFAKTNKDAKQLASINATLLQKAGFIDQTMSGVYTFLPLGLRVLNKIENIIRQEMDTLGAELLMPSIAPNEIWEQTGRLGSLDVLFKVSGANPTSTAQNDTEYVLNPTHEEVITPLAKKFHYSYKDLPFAVYQIQTKFRNEPRPKSGLLRCREFRMKDLYSFHTSEQDLQNYYEQVKRAYHTIFERLGLGKDTLVVLASGGDFTSGFSHEFQTTCETGEDIVLYAASADLAFNREIAPCRCPDAYPAEQLKPREEIKGEGVVGVEALAKFLGIPVSKTTKTMLFETETGVVVAGVVRGDYEINLLKLKKLVGCQALTLASSQTVKRVTGAEPGYAGPLHLPSEVLVYYDDALRGRANFECGSNRTHFHSINVNFGRDLPEPTAYVDIKIARAGDYYPQTSEVYQVLQASEVGNIFPLNVKFSNAFGYTYTDQDGAAKPVFMGSYGIGSSRVMGVLVEKFHDERGIIWPVPVAPFTVHLLSLGEQFSRPAEDLQQRLSDAGIDVLWDDRPDVSAGEKFADADLIGIPVRLVISARTKGKIEYKNRSVHESQLVTEQELLGLLKVLKGE